MSRGGSTYKTLALQTSPSVGVCALSLRPRSPKNGLEPTEALGEDPHQKLGIALWHTRAFPGFLDTRCFPELNEAPSEGVFPHCPSLSQSHFISPILLLKHAANSLNKYLLSTYLCQALSLGSRRKRGGEQRDLGRALSQAYISNRSENISEFSPIIRHCLGMSQRGAWLAY